MGRAGFSGSDPFGELGYKVVRGVFGPSEVAALASRFDWWREEATKYPYTYRHGNLMLLKADDPEQGSILRFVQWPAYTDPVIAGFRTDRRLLELAEPHTGPDVKQIINQLIYKPPGAAQTFYDWHQDARFRRPREAYRNIGSSYVQMMVAIDAHTSENGAIKVIPGSHRAGLLDLSPGKSVMDGSLQDGHLIEAGFDPAYAVDLLLEPGDVALWTALTIHGSPPNLSQGDRRALTQGYIRADDCDRGEWAWRGGVPQELGAPVLVQFEGLFERPEPHFVDGHPYPSPRP